MFIIALSALVLQVAPAQYDASYSCDCVPYSAQTSGILTTRATGSSDFDYDYPNTGMPSLGVALRSARRLVADSPGLELASKWQSSADVLIEGQIIVVPLNVAVVRVENGIATIEAHGTLSGVQVRVNVGTVSVSSKVDLVERVTLGSSASDQPSLTSLVENIADDYEPGGGDEPGRLQSPANSPRSDQYGREPTGNGRIERDGRGSGVGVARSDASVVRITITS